MLQYNNTINKFLNEKNIDSSFIEINENAVCYNKRDINSIISKYGMYKNRIVQKVCVDSVIGKYRGKTQKVLNELNDLFNEDAESYRKRSVSMLKYDSEEVVNCLKNSFIAEPIELKEIKKGKYIIGNNGMHRVNLLRVHYFNELNKCNSPEQIKALKIKYTIDVNVEMLDVIKTYSRYLISFINSDITIEDEIDENFLKTENVILYDDHNKAKKFNNNQLMEFVINNIDSIKDEVKKDLNVIYKSDEYFREYLKLLPKDFLKLKEK